MQETAWEKEYRESKLLTKDNKPQADVVRFVDFLREGKIDISSAQVLDLGSGTGRNSFYFSELGAEVVGFEISGTAIGIARDNAETAHSAGNLDRVPIYQKQSIGETFPLPSAQFDIALDVTSSNSLSASEREVFLKETHRVLKDNGYFFTKALCKDGDQNAKFLLKTFPGAEPDTYIHPDIHVTERVWSRGDFVETYQKYFKILHLEKKTSYTRMNNRVYKRNFWICYMKK